MTYTANIVIKRCPESFWNPEFGLQTGEAKSREGFAKGQDVLLPEDRHHLIIAMTTEKKVMSSHEFRRF